MKKNKLLISGLIVVALLALGAIRFSLAQTDSSNTYDDRDDYLFDSSSYYEELANPITAIPYVDSSDVIGIRIIPNPEHYSISKWYKSQGFSGSPQNLIVDGYEAVRDGRTVYVNAANIKIDPNNPASRLIYTNIYLISYNQDPALKTLDILGQIVKNWRFNTDLVERSAPAPTCSISAQACSADTDCGANQICASDTSLQANSCQLKETVYCSFDADCPNNFFCDSVKAKIIRDVKRISQAADITQALTSYRNKFNSYPALSAGSYLSGRTVSTWPSWSTSFLNTLGLSANLVDPINRLGYCPNADVNTCWNAETRSFYVPANSTSASSLLPSNSYAFVYNTNGGLNYNLCANLETTENTADLNYKFSPDIANLTSCVLADAPNTAPIFKNAQLSGEANKEFTGWLEFSDEQNNPLTWQMSLNSSAWSGPNGWPTLPVLQDTNNPNQKKIYAPVAGAPASYPITITVGDGRATTSKTLDIVIGNSLPFIEAANLTYTLNPTYPFRYTFYFSDENIVNYNTAFQVTRQAGTNNQLDPLSGTAANNFTRTVKTIAPGRYQVDYAYAIPTTFKVLEGLEYNYQIEVTDTYNNKSTKAIKINIENDAPRLDFNCSSSARLGKSYSCLLGPNKQGGLSQQALTYSSDFSFSGFTLATADPVNVFLSSAKITGTAGQEQTINIKATNEYGASSTKSFALQLNSYCGDDIKQNPNTEGRGGIYNNGREDCDGQDGVATGPEDSNLSKQYACATFDSNTPFPIPNNSYCVFKSPIDGGGYCGDGYCQMANEDSDTCAVDCKHTCQPSCLGKVCGSDNCGGTCGSCGVGEGCYGGQCCSGQGTIKLSLFEGSQFQGNSASPFAFFNDVNTSLTGGSVPSTYSATVNMSTTTNVLALPMHIESLEAGVSVSLSFCGQNYIYPSNLKNGKCTNSISGVESDWYKVGFDDSNWSAPNVGIYNGRVAVWAKDYDLSGTRLKNAWCRYTFDMNEPQTICAPDPSNKECGANGCGGSFRPDNCAATNNNNTNFQCVNNVCTCQESTCATGIKVDGDCAPIVSKCSIGATISCSQFCDLGLYCDPNNKTCQVRDDLTLQEEVTGCVSTTPNEGNQNCQQLTQEACSNFENCIWIEGRQTISN